MKNYKKYLFVEDILMLCYDIELSNHISEGTKCLEQLSQNYFFNKIIL